MRDIRLRGRLDEPTQRNIFFLFCRKSHITRVHTAHHDFFNFMSDEPTQRNIFLFFVRKSHITRVHTVHHVFLTSCQVSPHSATFFFFLCVNLISRESTQRITILQISRYTSSQSASQFTNDRWGSSTPSTWCQTYNLSIRKPIQ